MSSKGSALMKLLRFGAAALKPTKQADGGWRHAAVSAKAAARLRKAALLEGRCGALCSSERSTRESYSVQHCACTALKPAADGLRAPCLLWESEWPYDEPRERSKVFERPMKGHKVDHEAPARAARVQARAAAKYALVASRADPRTRACRCAGGARTAG
jgi:hypothetical protein